MSEGQRQYLSSNFLHEQACKNISWELDHFVDQCVMWSSVIVLLKCRCLKHLCKNWIFWVWSCSAYCCCRDVVSCCKYIPSSRNSFKFGLMQRRVTEHCQEAFIISRTGFQWWCWSRSSILVWTSGPFLCTWESKSQRRKRWWWSCFLRAPPGRFLKMTWTQRYWQYY